MKGHKKIGRKSPIITKEAETVDKRGQNTYIKAQFENTKLYQKRRLEKTCFQNKSKFIKEEFFSKHISIKTKFKQKIITK
jgi:hypothetical protein